MRHAFADLLSPLREVGRRLREGSIMRGGRPINPMGVRFIAHSALDGPSLVAFKAKLAALLGVGAKG